MNKANHCTTAKAKAVKGNLHPVMKKLGKRGTIQKAKRPVRVQRTI